MSSSNTVTLPNGNVVSRQSFEAWQVDFQTVGKITAQSPEESAPNTDVEVSGTVEDPRGNTLQFYNLKLSATRKETGEEIQNKQITVGSDGWQETFSFSTPGNIEFSVSNNLPERQSKETWEEA